MKNKHAGSNFDDFLEEEGILSEVEAAAVKRVIAFQVKEEMERQHLTKTAMATRMHTSRASLNRLLDPANPSVNLTTLQSVAHALGKKLQVELV